MGESYAILSHWADINTFTEKRFIRIMGKRKYSNSCCYFIWCYNSEIKLTMGRSTMIIIKAIAVYHLQCIPSNVYACALLCFIVVCHWLVLLISTRLNLLAPNRADSWPSAGEATLHNMVNTLRPRQDGRHFPDDIFKCIFLNENV